MTDVPLPAFDNPPVAEVVFGVGFDPVAGFLLPHVGLYWATIMSEFTRCETAAPLIPIESIIDPGSGLPLPRTWLIHKNEDRLIQLQSNWFHFNWRRREASQEYPHYESIKPLFQKHLSGFFEFLEGEGFDRPEAKTCELTYVNHIPSGQGWETIADMGKIMPDLQWQIRSNRFLPEPQYVSWQTTFNLPEDSGQLTIKFQSALQKVDGRAIFRLEISVRGIGEDQSLNGVSDWFELAHEWIVRGFADLTGREVQIEHWKRTDVTES